MSAQGLGSRAIIGEFYRRLEQDIGTSWVSKLGMMFRSDQSSETYKWLGMSPVMREWIGGRNAKGFTESSVVIMNKTYEATLAVLVDELRRDKTGQIMVRVRELADRTAAHWHSLLSTQILNGATTVCYDGQYFFDTDHSEGSSGTQSNDLSITLSTLPIVAGPDKGDPNAPSAEQLRHCIQQAVEAIYSFKDDQGEPMNELAKNFLVMVPTQLWGAASAAVAMPTLAMGETNLLPALARTQGITFDIVPNVRLNTNWGAPLGSPDQGQLAVFRTDGNVKPFILQEEEGVTIDAIAEGSEHAFKNNEHLYGVKAMRGIGYGFWQQACLVTLA